ncbi:peptide/nickel transport system substrate-binding protein [Ilumatobacter fluminis]|uniref:Peptide/nickel transport system substrate-binding protein n=1 Tax=Ilumatobacter fluminis TaxID=467091 RepID=A0A4R7I3J5_9ACTN|nr:peptide/nickel transport system substrate-binding protein [Ilumatobacter fluminis]
MIRTRKSRAVAALVAGALVIAACGGDDDSGDDAETEEPADDGGDDGGDEPADDGGDEPADDGGDEPADDGGDDGDDGGDDGEGDDSGDGDTGGDDTDDGEGDMADDMMAPVRGGVLTYLLEAESDTWDIPGANCAVACITVMRQVMDPLTIINDQNEVEPFLLESFEVNDDFTEYTLTMREGITFHDGTPADGAALQRNLVEMASGLLQGQVLMDLVNGVDSIELVDDMSVKLTFGRPYATFLYAIAERTGWLFAPSYWDNPERAGALAVGTGPFMMTEWVRGERTSLEANPNYWRTGADGEPLPYLDGIEFRPVPDDSARLATMQGGDADGTHDDTGENLEYWRTEWEGNLLEPAPDKEAGYLMFNAGKPPFDNPDMRRALALCTDRTEYQAFRAPENTIINGPFAEGALGYIDDPGFPQFDPDAGNALLDEIGRPDEIIYGTTNTPATQLTAELFVDMWGTNCGLNVTTDVFDQSELITKALTGDFQVFAWRNHGQNNPGLEYVWWHSRHTEGLALNFGRIIDEEIDSLMDQIQATTDQAEIDALAQQINQRFASEVYNLWLVSAEWEIPYASNVHGVGVVTLPSGGVAEPTIAGRTWLHEAWKES